MQRRLLTFVLVTLATAALATWWLYGGNLGQALQPGIAEGQP